MFLLCHFMLYIYCRSYIHAGHWIYPVSVLSGCGNLWGGGGGGDKDFWYILVCYVYVDSMFVSGGGGGGGCLLIVLSVFRSASLNGV